MPITVYAKSTCGTCRKARAYLDEQGVSFEVVDIISQPPDRALLEATVDAANVRAYLNPRSAIYRERKLGREPPTKAEAIRLMLKDPNLIKRPLIIKGGDNAVEPGSVRTAVTFGFNPVELDAKIIT